jgi:6-phosphofructokinase 2
MSHSSVCAALRRSKALAEIPLTQIVTLTMNPALDVSTSVKKMVPFTKMRCAPAHRDPGGGGINVARVLKRLGIEATAIYPAGGTAGQLLAALVEREGVRSIVIPALNETREDLTIFDETSREQFRLVFPGAPLSDIEWQECLGSVARITPRPGFVIASGSLPAGVPHDFFGRVAQASKAHSKVIVDTSGPFLKAALEHGVYLIKPNLHEFQELAGTAASDDASLIEAGRRLIERGQIEVIALSLGPDGALLITRDVALRANGLPIEPISVSGAGDSFLGAMVWSLANNGSLEMALRYGVAGGSAALLNPGTELCRPEDVHRLASAVTITPIARNHR